MRAERSVALAVMLVSGACRGRPLAAPAAAWQPGATEQAALLVLDGDGKSKLVCLPGPQQPRPLFPELAPEQPAPRQILDVGWRRGAMAAVRTAEGSAPAGSTDDELVLLTTNTEPRRLAKAGRAARFSPDGAALAYQTAQRDDGGRLEPPTSYVLDLATERLTRLDGFADPRWEAEGRYLRGTYLRSEPQPGQPPSAPRWTWLRARWDRQSGASQVVGPGSAQIPAPIGAAVAWSEGSRNDSGVAPRQGPCSVFLRPLGGVRHSVVGDFCSGVADDRGVRWSPDGQLLAFAHPQLMPGQRAPGTVVVDVVGIAGGRYRALSDLDAKVGPAALPIATGSGSVWFDWAPSQRFLAVQDGENALRVYDFQSASIASLGKGTNPTWSPGGAYLLILAQGRAAHGQAADGAHPAKNAVLLSGLPPAAPVDLGPARDARWLPAKACH